MGTSCQFVLWRLTLRLLASETQRPTPTNGSGCGRGVIIGTIKERTDCEGHQLANTDEGSYWEHGHPQVG
ncbi:hypothetical protein PF005_g16485 [Phytophthora fragariae]|uniref:Secreted protein n=1 Tax=Phytophthora fragariae TaxID=53985 RepID=A0A6A3QPQ9_9STRA|nr:hypothetical protein PF003_g35234 [Phytophthora fragariae]KAE8932117.1 hypothetical protein PF009_g17840 [Phytophthora fragariae]KAE8999804.1 hypothetical protein PF011_g14465 [Phytophthora fragariae]KAE9080790.1 hypothetical protein PF007_g22899 [Phytophthora fragariae]KAE9097284.1 hypothetical protein PF010_g16025 [Phytophthora fragariae]